MHTSGKINLVRYISLTETNAFAQVFWIVAFALLTALGARIEIVTYPVPFTLQTMFVLLAGAFLGMRNGALSQFLYLGMGSAGLPVFATGGALGIIRLLGPTGGYLLAFPIAAFLIGYLIQKRNDYLWILLSMSIGLSVIFIMGTIQLNIVLFQNWSESIKAGFLIFSWWDLIKLFAAASIYYQFATRCRPN